MTVHDIRKLCNNEVNYACVRGDSFVFVGAAGFGGCVSVLLMLFDAGREKPWCVHLSVAAPSWPCDGIGAGRRLASKARKLSYDDWPGVVPRCCFVARVEMVATKRPVRLQGDEAIKCDDLPRWVRRCC